MLGYGVARARVSGFALIYVVASHPLIVPRVRHSAMSHPTLRWRKADSNRRPRVQWPTTLEASRLNTDFPGGRGLAGRLQSDLLRLEIDAALTPAELVPVPAELLDRI